MFPYRSCGYAYVASVNQALLNSYSWPHVKSYLTQYKQHQNPARGAIMKSAEFLERYVYQFHAKREILFLVQHASSFFLARRVFFSVMKIKHTFDT